MYIENNYDYELYSSLCEIEIEKVLKLDNEELIFVKDMCIEIAANANLVDKLLNRVEGLIFNENNYRNCYVVLLNEEKLNEMTLEELSLTRIIDMLTNISEVIEFNITRNGDYEIINALKLMVSVKDNLIDINNSVNIKNNFKISFN